MFGYISSLSSPSLVASVLLPISLAQGIAFRPITREWYGRSFTIEIPATYEEGRTASIAEGSTLAFSGAPRSDGTHPMVQITLAHLPTLLQGRTAHISLEEFGEYMLKGIERRQDQWQVQATDSQLGHLRVKRYTWTGVVTESTYNLLAGTRMLGVMYVGIDGDIGFSLHTQDLQSHAKVALPLGEQSIRTFRLNSVQSQ